MGNLFFAQMPRDHNGYSIMTLFIVSLSNFVTFTNYAIHGLFSFYKACICCCLTYVESLMPFYLFVMLVHELQKKNHPSTSFFMVPICQHQKFLISSIISFFYVSSMYWLTSPNFVLLLLPSPPSPLLLFLPLPLPSSSSLKMFSSKLWWTFSIVYINCSEPQSPIFCY